MTDKNTPDRASDFDDIPTYEQPKKADIYSRMGRVAPQSIPAAGEGSSLGDTKDPEIKPLGDPSNSSEHAQSTPDAAEAASDSAVSTPKEKKPLFGKKTPSNDPEKTEVLNVQDPNPTEETTAFPRADHSAPLASDAPTTAAPSRGSYKDEDFAPAAPTKEPLLDEVPAERTVAAQTAPAAASSVPVGAATGGGMFTSSETAPPAPAWSEEPAPVAETPTVVESAKRGTIDFGLLIIRLLLGVYLIYSAIRVFFGVGGFGLNELQASFADYAMPEVLAIAIPAMELAAGVFLVFGLLTPVAAAVATVSTAFWAGHTLYTADAWSFSNIPDGVILAVILAGIALALQFTGPGLISLDTSRSWAKRPLASSWVFAIIGIAGAVALWWFGAAVNPLA